MFQPKLDSYEDISWISVSSYVTLIVSKKDRTLLKTLVESQFEVMLVYEFQAKANSYEDICWVSVWSYLNLCVSTKT